MKTKKNFIKTPQILNTGFTGSDQFVIIINAKSIYMYLRE